MSPRIYLDYNATTPVFPEVVEAMRACWAEPSLNPASQHEFGRRAHKVLEDTRDRIAELLGASTRDRVIFTSGGTESNNLAIRGLLDGRTGRLSDQSKRARLVTSGIEHPSVATLGEYLARNGCNVDHMPVDGNGVLEVEAASQLLSAETRAVVAMLANNETGVIQPVGKLAAICKSHGVPVHTDAAQIAGKLPLSFQDLDVATMTIAAHKFGGPVGIGALVVRSDVQLPPLLHGGVQQAGTRPGTESVPLAVGMRTALELWHSNRAQWLAHLEALRDAFESSLKAADSAIEVLGERADRLPTTSNIAFVGLDRQALFVALDQAGIACSTGSACASGSSEPSPTHVAMGLSPALVSSALRFSFGIQTTQAHVSESLGRILRICNNLRSRKVG